MLRADCVRVCDEIDSDDDDDDEDEKNENDDDDGDGDHRVAFGFITQYLRTTNQ